jgi:exosortase
MKRCLKDPTEDATALVNGTTTDTRTPLVSYLLLGVLIVALTVSFWNAWFWSARVWFPVAPRGNTTYSPGPLIPVLVLLMLSSRLAKLPGSPEIAKRDLFHKAFEALVLPAMTAVVRLWHQVRSISMSPERRRAEAYTHRAIAVWIIWGILAVAFALASAYFRQVPALGLVRLPLLFLHVVIFSAAVFYVAWRASCVEAGAGAAPAGWTSYAGGLALLVFFLLLHFAAVRGGEFPQISMVSFLGCLVAFFWYFYGWRVARLFVFPLAFMIFTLPMEWIEDRFGLPAQMFATKHSVGIMTFLGLKVQMIGKTSFLIIKDGMQMDFDVAAPCSGLKSLVALTAISATYGYLTQKNTTKMIVIMACGPFIAILANLVRLVAVGVVAQFWGREWAMEVHDRALPIYILAILLLLVIDKAINSKWLKIEDF